MAKRDASGAEAVPAETPTLALDPAAAERLAKACKQHNSEAKDPRDEAPAKAEPATYRHLPTQEPLQVRLRTNTARAPLRATAGSAGYDLFADEATVVPARSRQLIKTGLLLNIGAGRYGRIAPRSGLACKQGIDVLAGVIDADYRGEVGVILVNHSDVAFGVSAGDRIAQLILERIDTPPVHIVNDVGTSGRGQKGLGSTGK
tara:strand:- start:2568 stop:3176 length:609 start_codon:yes stop_codon:yes gene_type:complete